MDTNELIKSIEASGKIIGETGSAFESIHNGIREVENSMNEIEATTMEFSTGNSEVLNAITNLNEITIDRNTNFREVKDLNQIVNGDVKAMVGETDQIPVYMQDIENSLSRIDDMFGQVVDLSNIVKEQTANLNSDTSGSQIE